MIFLIGVFFGYVGAKLIQKKEVSGSNGKPIYESDDSLDVDDTDSDYPPTGGHPDPDKEEK